VPALIAEFAPDVVVHLAAQASVSASVRDPQRDYSVNAEGTRAIAAAALAAGATRVISASSAAVYGEPDPALLPLPETAPKAPANPYGVSKLAAEGLLSGTLLGTGCDFASFRFANVYGPRQDAAGEGGVVAMFCAAMAGEVPAAVYGTGTQTRDFVYVGDIVGAIIAAIDSDEPLGLGAGDDGAYNISTGTEVSVNELLMTLRQTAGSFGPSEERPAREGDVLRSSLDPSKAGRVFGWHAHQLLDNGLAMTWRWFAANS
jgi:UDP-glucose 4-epimerase